MSGGLWTTCLDLFSHWPAAVEREASNEDAPGEQPGYVLTGRGSDGRYYLLNLDPDPTAGIIIVLFDAQRPGVEETTWMVRPGNSYNEETGAPAPAGLHAALAGFAAYPYGDEIFVYRPAGEVVALVMFRFNDPVHADERSYAAPGVPWSGPVPPLALTVLTLSGQPPWPVSLQGDDTAGQFQRLVQAGDMVPLTELAPEPDMWWLGSDEPNEGAVEWIGPTGPGLPAPGIYRSRVAGEPPADVTWTRNDLGPFLRRRRADRVAVTEILSRLVQECTR